MSDATTLGDAAAEFISRIDAAFGLYLDATSGFKALRERLVNASAIVPDTQKKSSFYGQGDPNNPNNVIWHQATVEEIIARNAVGASNDQLLSQYLIVTLFHLWENEYRARIAATLDVGTASIKVGVFGDLRLLRNEILKHRGLLTEGAVQKLEVVKTLKPGEMIGLAGEELYKVVHAIKAELDRIVREKTGVDPLHRTIWHVT